MTAIVAIAVSVPSAPGYIGAFQLGCVLGLAIFGIPESEAIAYSIVLHLTQFVERDRRRAILAVDARA